MPPKSFMKGLRQVCDENGMLLIVDEIQTGFGRTGKYFGIEHFDVTPDILVFAKGNRTTCIQMVETHRCNSRCCQRSPSYWHCVELQAPSNMEDSK